MDKLFSATNNSDKQPGLIFEVSQDGVRQEESDISILNGILSHEEVNTLNQQQNRRQVMRSKEPEPEDGDLLSEAAGSKKKSR